MPPWPSATTAQSPSAQTRTYGPAGAGTRRSAAARPPAARRGQRRVRRVADRADDRARGDQLAAVEVHAFARSRARARVQPELDAALLQHGQRVRAEPGVEFGQDAFRASARRPHDAGRRRGRGSSVARRAPGRRSRPRSRRRRSRRRPPRRSVGPRVRRGRARAPRARGGSRSHDGGSRHRPRSSSSARARPCRGCAARRRSNPAPVPHRWRARKAMRSSTPSAVTVTTPPWSALGAASSIAATSPRTTRVRRSRCRSGLITCEGDRLAPTSGSSGWNTK